MWKNCAKNIVSEIPGHSEFWSNNDISSAQKVKTLIEEGV
jgi:hypothetical protein